MDNNKIKKNIYHVHDKSYKDLYSKKEIALDLLKNFVKKEFTKDLKPEDLILVNKSYVTSDYEELESDIVYSVNMGDNEVIFYILLEFQSKVDYTMPLRLLFYMCEILREHSKNAKYTKSNNDIKLPAVVPIVLYNGSQVWNVPTEFRRMFYNEEKFHSGILNFTYDIFDINNGFTKDELVKNKNVTSAIFLLDQKLKPKEFLERIKTIALFFDNLTDSELTAIKSWIRNTTQKGLAEKANEILEASKEDVSKMVANNAYILTEMEESAKKSKTIEIAKNLLDVLNDEIIAIKTGLTIEEVKQIRQDAKK